MEEYETIIIGAGASGLAAGCELAKSGHKVLILEARDRIGGRIHTIKDDRFDIPIEAGAEFIHGDLEVTQRLLTGYNIKYTEVEGKEWRTDKGQLTVGATYLPGFHFLNKHLRDLEDDITVNQFLEKYFADEKFNKLKTSVRKFVEGFDTADPERASVLKFREEWIAAKKGEPLYRVDGGYSQLMDALEKELKRYGGEIKLSTAVSEIQWESRYVRVVDEEGNAHIGTKALITVPLGILQANSNTYGAIRFSPDIPDKLEHARQIGFGSVIKIILQFDAPFWTTKSFENRTGLSLDNLGFIFSDSSVSAWWTQLPNKSAILTGWIGGPMADELKGLNDPSLLDEAIEVLGDVLGEREKTLFGKLKAWHVSNWGEDIFTRGSYNYSTVGDRQHIDAVCHPLDSTLFFAGEAMDIEHGGTVEGALKSGIRAAERILETSLLQVVS